MDETEGTVRQRNVAVGVQGLSKKEIIESRTGRKASNRRQKLSAKWCASRNYSLKQKKKMTADTITWNSIRNDILADSEIKKEYDRLTPEFEFARMEFCKRTPNLSQAKLITTGLIPIYENQEKKI